MRQGERNITTLYKHRLAIAACCIGTVILAAACPRAARTLLRVDNNAFLDVTSVHVVDNGSESWGDRDIEAIPSGSSRTARVTGNVLDILVRFANPRPDRGGCEVIYNTSLEIYGWTPTEAQHVLVLTQANECTDVYYEFDPFDN